jgi:hypothetical protein
VTCCDMLAVLWRWCDMLAGVGREVLSGLSRAMAERTCWTGVCCGVLWRAVVWSAVLVLTWRQGMVEE